MHYYFKLFIYSALKSLYENTGIKVAKFIEPLISSSRMSRCEWFESFVKLEYFININQSNSFLPVCTFVPMLSNRYMFRNHLSIILPQNVEYLLLSRQISRIFNGVGILKGLKSHVPGFSQMKTWYQNVRKDLSYKMSIMRAFRSNTLGLLKNKDIYAT